MTSLSVVRQCPGIPDGPMSWLRSDAGFDPLAAASSGMDVWPDVAGGGAPFARPHGATAPRFMSSGGPDGLPFVRFNGAADALLLVESAVPLVRDFVVFMVARYTPGTLLKGRVMQGVGENWACGYSTGGRRGMYVYDGAVYEDTSVPPLAASESWSISTCVATTTRYVNEFRTDGVRRGTSAVNYQQPFGLVIGTGGYRSDPSNVSLCVCRCT